MLIELTYDKRVDASEVKKYLVEAVERLWQDVEATAEADLQ